MSDQTSNDPFTVVYATDLAEGEEVAFEHALAVAGRAGGVLHVVHAGGEGERDAVRGMPEADPLLERWRGAGGDFDASGQSSLEVKSLVHTCCDDPVDTLLDAVAEIGPDLIVVGKHSRTEVGGFFHDSVSESLARNLDVPTLFVPLEAEGFVDGETGGVGIERVVIPAVDQATLLEALQQTRALMERLGRPDVEYIFLHAGEERELEQAFVPETDPQLSWQTRQEEGPLHEAIAEVCQEQDVDLVAMGTRGHDSLADVFRGSRTERVVRGAACPIFSIPLHD